MADSQFDSRLPPVQNQDWLVGNPSGAGATAALWIGSAGLLILGVIPILYGALHAEMRVSLAELGMIATVETLLIGVSSAVAAMLFSCGNPAPQMHDSARRPGSARLCGRLSPAALI